MRITFILTQSLESPGGAGRYLPLAKALTNIGHQITIIALHHNLKNIREKCFFMNGVKVIYVGQMHVKKIGSSKYYYGLIPLTWIILTGTIKLTYAALITRCEAIHICKAQPMNIIAGWVAKKIKKVPLYLDSDDYETQNNRFKYTWQQKIVARFENQISNFATGITVSNSFIANHYKSLGYPINQIIKIPHGINPEIIYHSSTSTLPEKLAILRTSLSLKGTDRVIVYIGSMSLLSHAIDLLVKAFQIVYEHIPQSKLLLVGGGEDIDAIQKLVNAYQLDEQIIFTGRVKNAEIFYYYRLGEISIDPKYKTELSESTLSIKVLESIGAGVPCIAADTGDTKSIIGKSGLVVEPGNIEALASAIIDCLENPSRLEEMKNECKALQNKYGWSALVREFEQIYSFQ